MKKNTSKGLAGDQDDLQQAGGRLADEMTALLRRFEIDTDVIVMGLSIVRGSNGPGDLMLMANVCAIIDEEVHLGTAIPIENTQAIFSDLVGILDS